MAADEYKRNQIYAAATSSQAARQINIIPEYKPDDSRKIGVYEKPLTVEETFTAKEVKGTIRYLQSLLRSCRYFRRWIIKDRCCI